MEQVKRRGRPLKFGETLPERVHLRISAEKRAQAEREAERLNISVPEVYRRWFDRGSEAA